MSQEEVLQRMREDLIQLRQDMRDERHHDTRSMLLSAAAGVILPVSIFFITFKLLS